MGRKKKYGSPGKYEKKLNRVMERLNVDDYNFDWSRDSCWVQFHCKGELYQFDHSVDNARRNGIELRYGSDAFAQVVLSLEDLARMVERGIYDLQTWVSGMKMLPPVKDVPSFFKFMGFNEIPEEVQVKARYRNLAKQMHPDNGGNKEDFHNLKEAAEKAIQYFNEVGEKE